MSGDAEREEAVERALARLGVEDKVRLLSGQDFWTLPALPQIGLASLVMSDGPVGVRGTGWAPDDPSVALPSPTALAATWDVALARTAGRMLGQECRRKGVHVLLAPTVNLHRSPLGGRHFECFSEDPFLTGEIGAGYVTGVQEQGVGTTVKHFVGNDSETDRMTVDVRAGERTLRELYLAPFARITAAGAWGAMAAYNTVNGLTMTEHGPLQNDVLKREWDWDGVIVSDWTAARSTVPSALGGLDVVMPAVGDPWGPALLAAVRSGEVPEKVLDDKVRRVLRLAARVGALDGAVTVPPLPPPRLDGSEVAREIATRSFVLARNEQDLLPLDAGSLRTVALLGALAADARVLGGGSAQVFPPHVISPRDGLTAALPAVVFAPGADPRPHLPAAVGGYTATLRSAGFRVLYATPLPYATVRWMGSLPSGVDPGELSTVEISGRITPAVSGVHELSIIGFGQFVLRIAGDVIFEGEIYADDADPDTVFHEPVERRFPVPLTLGDPVDVSLTLEVRPASAGFVNVSLGYAAPGPSADDLLDQAVAVARDADVAVVVVGTTEEVESEGFDRTTLALPGRQDELVFRVAAANPRTVVVVNAGSPVLMPWAEEVPSILLTWFPGQEAGAALADVLLGRAEPGGRLPTTWPRRDEDALPTTPVDGVLSYDEGVFIGYRAWQRGTATPLFPFGHGLGYTTWSYESLTIEPDPAHAGTAVVRLRNTGARPGREVVQIYAGAVVGTTIDRPLRWLAGFAPVTAAPGETVEARIPLPERAFQIWDDGWQAVPGTYRIEAARSVEDRPLSTEIRI
ncbi:beta-glucosidase family protein [Catenuloplanes indicus]|uniref:Beta-glucosidase n=1 Tax=Catenuloplanes indicus TaxID=137267 RepID=A0AAE3W0B4_9ACTN|nr:glycoside hydrolase family 3 C-terminal domain-containing protein [Catenuloplanes indicus]MDQ0366265.1 beta-glucosidase [Catenuloplanes indicus]